MYKYSCTTAYNYVQLQLLLNINYSSLVEICLHSIFFDIGTPLLQLAKPKGWYSSCLQQISPGFIYSCADRGSASASRCREIFQFSKLTITTCLHYQTNKFPIDVFFPHCLESFNKRWQIIWKNLKNMQNGKVSIKIIKILQGFNRFFQSFERFSAVLQAAPRGPSTRRLRNKPSDGGPRFVT